MLGSVLISACGIDSSTEQLPGGVLLQYERSGGIKGGYELITIHSNGRVKFESNGGMRDLQLSPDELEGLLEAISERRFEVDRSVAPTPRPIDWLELNCLISRDGKTIRIDAEQGPVGHLLQILLERTQAVQGQ
jgi:hypothetical protein